MVYWLVRSPSEQKVECWNQDRFKDQPLLAAKAVHLQPSLHLFGTDL